jgi:hypothetical protein
MSHTNKWRLASSCIDHAVIKHRVFYLLAVKTVLPLSRRYSSCLSGTFTRPCLSQPLHPSVGSVLGCNALRSKPVVLFFFSHAFTRNVLFHWNVHSRSLPRCILLRSSCTSSCTSNSSCSLLSAADSHCRRLVLRTLVVNVVLYKY